MFSNITGKSLVVAFAQTILSAFLSLVAVCGMNILIKRNIDGSELLLAWALMLIPVMWKYAFDESHTMIIKCFATMMLIFPHGLIIQSFEHFLKGDLMSGFCVALLVLLMWIGVLFLISEYLRLQRKLDQIDYLL